MQSTDAYRGDEEYRATMQLVALNLTIRDRDEREMIERLRGAIGDAAELRMSSPRDPSPQRADLLVIASWSTVSWHRVRTAAAVDADVPLLVVARRWSEEDERMALDSGAIGYLALDLPPLALARSIHAALRGEVVFRRRTLGRWLRPSFVGMHQTAHLPELTKRQQEVASLLTTGAADKEIAVRLGIAVATVQKHVSKLLRTVGASNRAAAVFLVLGGTRLTEQS